MSGGKKTESIILRLSPELKWRITSLAQVECRTYSDECRWLIEQGLKHEAQMEREDIGGNSEQLKFRGMQTPKGE